VLTTLAARTVEQEGDELVQARLRGLDARKKLVDAAGGFLDSAGVAQLLGMTTAAVHKRYKARQLLGIREEKRRIVYPAFQFDGERVIRDFPTVLQTLADAAWTSGRSSVSSPVRTRGWEAGHPSRRSRSATVERVLAAARTFGQHGAA
jgi:hypothetical protein